jgi:hypothetical protein
MNPKKSCQAFFMKVKKMFLSFIINVLSLRSDISKIYTYNDEQIFALPVGSRSV